VLFCLADFSQQSSLSCQSTKKCARFRQFQEKADEAGLVVFVLSKDFAESRFTREQVILFKDNYRIVATLLTTTVTAVFYIKKYINTKCVHT